MWNWLAIKAPEERPETEVASRLAPSAREQDGLRAVLRVAGGAPDQDQKRSEDCDREMQTGRSPAPVAQFMSQHARSYTPKANKVISANPDRQGPLF
jgi:hypothetical protein